MPVIQLQFFTTPESWVQNLCRQRLAVVKVLSLKRAGGHDGYVTHFVEISSSKTSANDLARDLRNANDVSDSELATVGASSLVGSVVSKGCHVCNTLLDADPNCFLAPATTEHDCQMSYKLFMSGSGLPVFLQKLHDKGVLYKIADLSLVTTKKGLTAHQERALKYALELGYYEFPKRISTGELSQKLGVKAGTLSEVLRRAEKNIITSYFERQN